MHMRADYDRRTQSRSFGKFRKLGLYLQCELASRHDNENKLAFRCVKHSVYERNEKRRQLAGSGIRDTDHIPPRENVWNRRILNRRRVLKVSTGDVSLQLLVYGKIRKRVLRTESFPSPSKRRLSSQTVKYRNSSRAWADFPLPPLRFEPFGALHFGRELCDRKLLS